jgi:hypothetical protein
MKLFMVFTVIFAGTVSAAMAGDTMDFKGKSKGSFAISNVSVDPKSNHAIFSFTANDTGKGTLVGRFHSTSTATANANTGESTLPEIKLVAADGKSGFYGKFTDSTEQSPTDVTWNVSIVEGFGRLKGATGEYSVRVQSTGTFADLITEYVTTRKIVESQYVATFYGKISTPGSTKKP